MIPYFKSGSWNADCMVCGTKHKASELRRRWDGLWVCPHDWETRHPQDFLKSRSAVPTVTWSRSEQPDVFISPTPVETYHITSEALEALISDSGEYITYV